MIAPVCVAVLLAGAPDLAGQTISAVPASTQSKVTFRHSTVSLVNGGRKDSQWLAGIDIEMAKGWKTYWKVPGDSGVPPVFDWSKSQNVRAVEVMWPAPHRYSDITGNSIGYKKRVVFPLKVTALDPSRPVRLNLSLDYGICRGICILAKANVETFLPQDKGSGPGLPAIEKFAALIPPARPASETISKVSAVGGKDDTLLVVTFARAMKRGTDILVEGPEEAFFNAPEPGEAGASPRRFVIRVEGLDGPEDLKGRKLKLTVLAGKTRFVSNVTVD